MKKIIGIISILFLITLLNCKKENRISKNLEGKWIFTEYSIKNSVKNDFSAEIRSFEFFKNKKAYTKTMKGIYRIDFFDNSKVSMIDTFEYELKRDEIDISKVKNKKVNGVLYNNVALLKRRFSIKEYKKDKLKLVRIDSTDLYIKATKQ